VAAVNLVLLVMAPLLLGLIAKTKALFAGRVGPPVLQPYYDIARLFRKSSVFSQDTTWVFRAGPIVGLVSTLCAAMLVPIGPHPAALSFSGDLFFFAYVLALGRFFTVSAALDTGSPFEGMGGAREALYACLAEPALVLALLVPAVGTRSLSLSSMLGGALAEPWTRTPAPLVLIIVSMFIVLLVENCRIPFDDPNTHLESQWSTRSWCSITAVLRSARSSTARRSS
jgi:formate hydrogenlyase subunit 4